MMSNSDNIQTDFLFPDTDFLTGMGSVMNIFGNYYEFNESISSEEADAKALLSDAVIVGRDIEEAAEAVLTEAGLEVVDD